MRYMLTLVLFSTWSGWGGCFIHPPGWNQDIEYRYLYNTQVLTNIPSINETQYSGLKLSSLIRIQPQPDSSYLMKLENPELVSYNGEVIFNANHTSKGGIEIELANGFTTWLTQPIHVYHKKGKVELMKVSKDEPEFIVDVKKAIISQLQNDLTQIFFNHNQNDIRQGIDAFNLTAPELFITEEETVTGKCDTTYSLHPLHPQQNIDHTQNCQGQQYIQITKNKDFDKCSIRPVSHNEYGRMSQNDRTSASSTPSHSSETTTIICGTLSNYTILTSTTRNMIIIPTGEQMDERESIVTTSYSYLTLQSYKHWEESITMPSRISDDSFKIEKSLILSQSSANEPDINSAPYSIHNSQLDKNLLKFFIETNILNFVGKIYNNEVESDLSKYLIEATELTKLLSLEELKDVEQSFECLVDVKQSFKDNSKYKESTSTTTLSIFYDAVSNSGTNPSLMFLKERFLSDTKRRKTLVWSFLMSNSIRLIRTPTVNIFEELIDLLKNEDVQTNTVLKSTIAMSLTERIYQACVNQRSYKNTYSYNLYGSICTSNSTFITENILPFIQDKLSEDSKSENINGIMIWVNALGNLGTFESSKVLLEIIEGKYTQDPHARSIAVYKLIRPTFINPTLYKPVYLSMIENDAENPQVRMAAITGLMYASPSTSDLQRIALRTWREQSNQVHSYIYTTLQTLSQLPAEVSGYRGIKRKAELVLLLAKPTKLGLQFSRNLQTNDFVKFIRSTLSHKLQFVGSPDSIIPRSLFARAEMKGDDTHVEMLEASIYFQGFETLMKSFIQSLENSGNPNPISKENEHQNFVNLLQLNNSNIVNPELHLTLKSLGLQTFMSFSKNEIAADLEDIHKEFGKRIMHFNKYIDLFGYETLVPTESGLSVLIQEKNPLVFTQTMYPGDENINMDVNTKIFLKKQISAGPVSSLTEQLFFTGVDTSTRLDTSLKFKLAGSLPNFSISLIPSGNNSLQFDVNPFTATHTVLGSRSNHQNIVKSIQSSGRDFKISEVYGDLIRISATADMGEDLQAMIPHMLKMTAKKLLTVPFPPVVPCRKIQFSLTLNKLNVTIPEIEANFSTDMFLNKLPFYQLFSRAKTPRKNETNYKSRSNQITISSAAKTLYTYSLNNSINYLTQIQSANSLNSTCTIESRRIRSFDHVEYDFEKGNCEFVVVSEKSSQPSILITTKNTEVKQFVTIFIMGDKYELVLDKEKNSITLLINGEEQDIRRNANDLYENRHINLIKEDNGVHHMKILLLGIDILLDGSKLEIISSHLIWRNRFTGLCGDMNGEQVDDHLTANGCLSPTPQEAAQTFVIGSTNCTTPTDELKKPRVIDKGCTIKNDKITNLTNVFNNMLLKLNQKKNH